MTDLTNALAQRFREVRAHTLRLVEPLSTEDQCVQSMPDASPSKWHLAHTTWFFEALLLTVHSPGYVVFDASFAYLYNSYYESQGPRHPRKERGLLTRPSRPAVLAYREYVDKATLALLQQADLAQLPEIARIIELGLNHEQQHQELILTDILHLLSCNPTLPAYLAQDDFAQTQLSASQAEWLDGPSGIVEIGHAGDGFAYDNELPRHQILLQPFQIADRVVTCAEYATFIEDGGYRRPELWLSDGWAAVQQNEWRAPAYWYMPEDLKVASTHSSGWHRFGLAGLAPIQPDAPVANLSFYEAAAYAEWAGARLPTEFEWEAAYGLPGIRQMTRYVWQWTRSSYDPYPGYRPMVGAAAEYNGKFMVGQLVLRGSSLATPTGHTRPSYRNFFPPAARWQFTGVRLARSVSP